MGAGDLILMYSVWGPRLLGVFYNRTPRFEHVRNPRKKKTQNDRVKVVVRWATGKRLANRLLNLKP